MSSLSDEHTATRDAPLRAPLGRAALGGLIAPAVIGGLFAVAAASQPGADGDAGRSALLGLLSGVMGAAAGLVVVWASGSRAPAAWPMTLLFAGGVRLFGGLGLAVPLYMVSGAEKLPFWGVFLAVALVAIVGEVAAMGPFLRSLSAPRSPVSTAAEARSA